MKYFVVTFAIFTAIGAIIMASYFANEFLRLEIGRAKNEAMFQCAQSSRYEVSTEKGTTTWYPAKELYEKCLLEKEILN